jgi:hypothetical protein
LQEFLSAEIFLQEFFSLLNFFARIFFSAKIFSYLNVLSFCIAKKKVPKKTLAAHTAVASRNLRAAVV